MRRAGSARRGTGMWLLQRASAVLMALWLPSLLVYILSQGPRDYASWRALYAPWMVKVAVLLFVAALLVHGWIGLREILIDYVHPLTLRLLLYLVIAVVYLGCLIWAADILWRLAP
ncbi:MAG: succinate dehydrogenase, hydrophobic membrane anchor protein [Thiobacillaceae bacterium]